MKVLFLAAVAVLAGCERTSWGVWPGDGFTAVPLDAEMVLDAGMSLRDAPPLGRGVVLVREGGRSVPFDLAWDADAPSQLRVRPEQPLAPEASYRLRVSTYGLGGPHHAEDGLPEPVEVAFHTGSALRVLGFACDAGAGAALLLSEPVLASDLAQAVVVYDWLGEPVPGSWTPHFESDRLYRFEATGSVERLEVVGTLRAAAGSALSDVSVACDATSDELTDQALGRAVQK